MERKGLILKNRYCLIEKLGKGGNGQIYLARDLQLGVTWAVKEFPSRKRSEAKMLSGLSHPGIPRMIDYIEEDDAGFLVMEYIKGITLEKKCREGKPIPFRELLAMAQSILEILSYLHTQDPPILFGDLKPSNLMISENRHMYLLDFGSAVSGYGNPERSCEGTPGYAAPEQYQGRILPSSDIYAFGKTMESVSGKRIRLFRFLHPDWSLFIKKCTKADAEKRWKDAQEALKALLAVRRRQGRMKLFAQAGLGAMALAACLIISFLPGENQQDFYHRLTETTDRFEALYDTSRAASDTGRELSEKESTNERKDPTEIITTNNNRKAFITKTVDTEEETIFQIAEDFDFAATDKELRVLLQDAAPSAERGKILYLLAINAELAGNQERAALFYEDLILSEKDNPPAYAAYGRFLYRTGQNEKSLALLRDVRDKIGRGELTPQSVRDFRLWEKEIQYG